MSMIIIKILKVFGWQKLLKWTWEAISPSLDEICQKTETKLDDDMKKFFDKIINELVTNGDIKSE